MVSCYKCHAQLVSFNQMKMVYIQGKGKVTFCINCYNHILDQCNMAISPGGKSWVIRPEDIRGDR